MAKPQHDTWTGRELGSPTDEQLHALRAYAAENGRNWKSQLLADWANGRDEGYLRQVRNTFGPRWLALYDIAKD